MRAGVRQLLLVVLVVLPAVCHAQVVWQPTAPPLVTAENEPWYRTADAIVWSGDYYYPAGAMVYFNGNQMVRAGSYRGIPLYTDATRDPNGVVYVPLAGGLLQPYERRRSGQLAGTTGNGAPSFPTDIGAQGAAARDAVAVDLAQTPGPPSFARPYDVAPLGPETSAPLAAPAAGSVATGGRSITLAPRPAFSSASRPKGVNGVWVSFDGREWFSSGPAEVFDGATFTRRGSYHGFPVYTKRADANTIYIPSVEGLVTPYSRRN